jgi:hypothetical protein
MACCPLWCFGLSGVVAFAVVWPMWRCDICGGVVLMEIAWEPPIVVEFAM